MKKYGLPIMIMVIIVLLFLLVDWISSIRVGSYNVEEANRNIMIDLEPKNVPLNREGKSQPDTESNRIVYLTFDDGPSPVSNDILDTLKTFDAKATFFMLDPAMRANPDVVKRTVMEGHAVGLHGVTHDKNKFYQSELAALSEMKTAQETLLRITGVTTHLIRTPYGSVPYLTESFRDVLNHNGFRLWDWNVDSSDWNLMEDEYVQQVISQIEELDKYGITPIILMHDQDGTAHHLSTLLAYLKEHGYKTGVIDEHMESYSFNCYDRCYPVDEE